MKQIELLIEDSRTWGRLQRATTARHQLDVLCGAVSRMEFLWNKGAPEKISGASTESKPFAVEQTFPSRPRIVAHDLARFSIARILMLMPPLPAVFSD